MTQAWPRASASRSRFWQLLVVPAVSRIGRNPKSGEQVLVPGKQVPHFKAGKELRERVDLVGGNEEDAPSSGSSEPMPSLAGLHAMH